MAANRAWRPRSDVEVWRRRREHLGQRPDPVRHANPDRRFRVEYPPLAKLVVHIVLPDAATARNGPLECLSVGVDQSLACAPGRNRSSGPRLFPSALFSPYLMSSSLMPIASCIAESSSCMVYTPI